MGGGNGWVRYRLQHLRAFKAMNRAGSEQFSKTIGRAGSPVHLTPTSRKCVRHGGNSDRRARSLRGRSNRSRAESAVHLV